jgi:hypothetical protein
MSWTITPASLKAVCRKHKLCVSGDAPDAVDGHQVRTIVLLLQLGHVRMGGAGCCEVASLPCRYEHRPELNDVLYLHHKGIEKLENLEV